MLSEKQRYKFEALARYLDQSFDTMSLPSQALLRDVPYKPPMTTLEISGGKKQKVRPGDILGALTGDGGIRAEQVGKISIFDNCAYVAVTQDVAQQAFNKLEAGKLKGRSFRVRRIKS